jgi:sortase (surface protein transpeptidase)
MGLAASLLLFGLLTCGLTACARVGELTAQLPAALRVAVDDVREVERHRPDHTSSPDRPQRVDRHHGPRPTSIAIPAIGVNAPLISLGLNPDGSLEVPTDFGEAGWYEQGPEPGEFGPAVIAGHVDSYTGPAVFYRLPELNVGDQIAVGREDGTTVRFLVNRVTDWPKTSFPTHQVYGDTSGSVLRLVTCSGSFDESTGHYVDNTIVYARHR